MTLPVWPVDVPTKPIDGWTSEPVLPPIKTEMDGGNVRQRARPGDKVRVVTQSILMTNAQLATFDAFLRDTIFNGSLRFTMPIFTGFSFEAKTVQLSEPKYNRVGTKRLVSMSLRVYD